MSVMASQAESFGGFQRLLWSLSVYERLHGKRPGSVLQLGCAACRWIPALRELGMEAAGAESLPEFLEGPLDDDPYAVRAVKHRVPLASGPYDLVLSSGYLQRFACHELPCVVAEHLRLARGLAVMEIPKPNAGAGVGSTGGSPAPCRRPAAWWRSLLQWLGAEAVSEGSEWQGQGAGGQHPGPARSRQGDGWLVVVPGQARATRRRVVSRLQPETSPSVSIVIPCYNLGAYLPETLESVRRQTRPDWEAIVVNDGSTDGTREAVREFVRRRREPRLRYLEQPNRGLPAARNAGIARARGRYILPLDADDLLEPTYLEETVEVLEGFPEFGIVFTHLRAFGSEQWEAACPPWHPCRLLTQNRLPYASLFRREVWESTGGYDPAMREGYEDWDFWIGAAEAGWQGTCVPKKLFLYRRRPGSMLSRSLRFDRQLRARIRSKHRQLVQRCQQATGP